MRSKTAAVIATFTLLVAAAPPRPTNNFVTIPLSKRSNFADEDGVVDIAALNAHVAKTIAKIDRGYANYEKNTGTVHPSARSLLKRGSDGIALTNQTNLLWQGAIAVGYPPVTYTVDFDTGSGDLVLPGPQCGSSCSGHAVYHPEFSWTSNILRKLFSITDHVGSSTIGVLYTDTVHIAGLTANIQTIAVASQYSSGLSSSSFSADGYMGMGFRSIASSGAPTVFETLMLEKQVDSPVFAFKFAPSGSELHIGGTNPKLYVGNIFYTPVTDQSHWQVNMDTVLVNGTFLLAHIKSIINTGTNLIIGDIDNVDRLYQAIHGKAWTGGFYTFPCANAFHTISFTFGGRSFPIAPATFNLGRVSPNSPDCVGGIVARSGLPYWVIGDIFLAGVYTVFDFGNTRVGFAVLA